MMVLGQSPQDPGAGQSGGDQTVKHLAVKDAAKVEVYPLPESSIDESLTIERMTFFGIVGLLAGLIGFVFARACTRGPL